MTWVYIRSNSQIGWRRLWQYACICTTVALAGLVLHVFYSPIRHRFVEAKPTNLDVADAHYFTPLVDEKWIKASPFTQAVIVQLKDEAVAAGQKVQIVVATSGVVSHPTPEYQARLTFDTSKYDVAGYFFLRRTRDGRMMYESLPHRYTEKDSSVVWTVPASDENYDLFMLIRVSLVGAERFPERAGDCFRLHVP